MSLLRLVGSKEKDKFAYIIRYISAIHDFVIKESNEVVKDKDDEVEIVDWVYRDVFNFILEERIKKFLSIDKSDILNYFTYLDIIDEYIKNKHSDSRSFVKQISNKKLKNYQKIEDLLLNIKMELDIARKLYLKEKTDDVFNNNKILSFVNALKEDSFGQHQISTYVNSCFVLDEIDLEFDRIHLKKQPIEDYSVTINSEIKNIINKKILVNQNNKIKNDIQCLDFYTKYFIAKKLNRKQEFKSYLMNLLAEKKFNNFNRKQNEKGFFGFNQDEIAKIMSEMNFLYAKIKSNYEFEAEKIIFSLPYLFETTFEDKNSRESFVFGERGKKDVFMFYNFYKKESEYNKLLAPYILAYNEAAQEFILKNKYNCNMEFNFEEIDNIEIQVEEMLF